jgi:hypothetical protein
MMSVDGTLQQTRTPLRLCESFVRVSALGTAEKL